MRMYEIILDGELTADLTDSPVRLQRRNFGGATILSFPVVRDDTLSHVLSMLESLGIGVTAVRQVDDAGDAGDADDADEADDAPERPSRL